MAKRRMMIYTLGLNGNMVLSRKLAILSGRFKRQFDWLKNRRPTP